MQIQGRGNEDVFLYMSYKKKEKLYKMYSIVLIICRKSKLSGLKMHNRGYTGYNIVALKARKYQ